MELEAGLFEVEPNRNAEAYRNLQQVPVPGRMDKFLDFVDIGKDGCTLLGCSNLTGRFWCGSLWYFKRTESAPDVDKCLAAVECETGVCDGKFLDDKYKVVVGEDSGVIQVLDLVEAEDKNSFHFTCLASTCEHDDSVSCLSTFNDKKRFVSGSLDSSIKVWDIEAVVPEHTYRPAHVHHVTSVASNPHDKFVFTSSSLDCSVLLWDTRRSQPASVLFRGLGFSSVDWHPHKAEVVGIGSISGFVHTVDIRYTREPLAAKQGFNRPVHKIKFLDRMDLVAACADSTEVKVFCTNFDSIQEIYTDDRHTDFVRGIAWNPTDQSLYTCGWDQQVLKHMPNESPMKMEMNEYEADVEIQS